ncbi:MAG: hypothetical protein ACP5PP_08635 [Fervidobacterium sp.]
MRKGISTSIIRANVEKLHTLPNSTHYELTFFKPHDLEVVLNYLKLKNATFGVHSPFVYRYKYTHPFPTALEPSKRLNTYNTNLACAKLASRIGAQYVIIHFPGARQFDDWRKTNIINEAIRHIARMNQIIETRIENVYLNEYFHKPEDYVRTI